MDVPSESLESAAATGRWQQRLVDVTTANDVPGAVLGVLRIDPATGAREQVVLAAGVLNLDTGLACTPDSLFQIGSITKAWTATLVLRLVADGRLDLDAPLVAALPGLRLPDGLAERATLRHLLTHTSGLDGDVITDTGRGDDCLAAYVDGLAGAGINHPLGATFSYCNSGYVLAGRIAEVVTGGTWDAAIRSEIAEPLGLPRVHTLPEECMQTRFAVGHVGEKPHVAAAWGLPRSLGPAGLITCPAADLLGFAALHLTGGRSADGAQVLPPEAVAAMQAREVTLPDRYTLGESWGLGWSRFDWGGPQVIGHDGNTLGQDAYLRMIPELGLAVTLLTNGGGSADAFHTLVTELFETLAGVTVPPRVEPLPGAPLGIVEPYLGRYRRAARETEVFVDEGLLRMRTTVTGPLAELVEEPVEEHDLRPVGRGAFAYRDVGEKHWTPVVFYRLPDGSRYVHHGVRANPLVSS